MTLAPVHADNTLQSVEDEHAENTNSPDFRNSFLCLPLSSFVWPGEFFLSHLIVAKGAGAEFCSLLGLLLFGTEIGGNNGTNFLGLPM